MKFLVRDFVKLFFYIFAIFNKKATIFKNMSLRYSIKSWKYVHFWTLVLNTILILKKFPFQLYISCRHLNFDTTYEIGHHGNFLPFQKLGILRLVDNFVVCTKIFLEAIEPYKNVRQKISLNSKIFTGLVTGLGLYREPALFTIF